jgi:hypothetical protein
VASLIPRSRAVGLAFAVLCGGLGCAAEQPGTERNTSQTTGGVGGVAGNLPLAGTGALGGLGGVSGAAASGGSGGSAGSGGVGPIDPQHLDECGASNPAGLDAAAVQSLRDANVATGMRWLYPYDGTVFPRGLLPPQLMWEGPEASAVYVHVTSQSFEYEGCLLPSAAGQLALPTHVWEAMGDHAGGEADPFELRLALLGASGAFGPITEQLVIARATLKGSLYYNSYVSKLVTGAGGVPSGAVLKIPPGGTAEVLVTGKGCHGCHSVSADGARLVARDIPSYALSPNAPPLPMAPMPEGATFVGMYPDGSLYLTNASGGGVGPQAKEGPVSATLFETDTGVMVANTGIAPGALMPTFSNDGKLLVFTDQALNSARGLAVMDFDVATRTAKNPRTLYMDPAQYPAWPFLLPDNQGVVFARTESSQFTGEGAMVATALFGNLLPGFPVPMGGGPPSDLHLLDVESGSALLLARAMGFASEADAASDTTYLPFGALAEAHHNYYPTVSPVAAGGYFWVFFDSIRHYGNMGLARQLWGAAVTVAPDGSYSTDPSHPAFYVPGQEWGTGNHRAFTALDPCREDGESCEAGLDCCSGFCTGGVCGVPDAPRCSMTNESCAAQSDCCDAAELCLGGFCGEVLVPD